MGDKDYTREAALNMAIDFSKQTSGSSADYVVSVAKIFLAFLEGKNDKSGN